MTSDLAIIKPNAIYQLSTILDNTILGSQLDTDTRDMTRQQELHYIIDSINKMATISLKISQAILNLMYRVYSRSLYTEPLDVGQPIYDTFNDWAENVLAPLLEGRVDSQTVTDWIRITNNVLAYTLTSGYVNKPIKVSIARDRKGREYLVEDPNGKVVTGRSLIALLGYGTLKVASSHMPTEKRQGDGHQIIRDALTLPPGKFKVKYQQYVACDYVIEEFPDGTANVIFRGVSEEVVRMIRGRLKHNGTPHVVQMDAPQSAEQLAG